MQRSSINRSTFAGGLIALLTLDIALGFAYGSLPTNWTALRGLLDAMQFLAMAFTMAYTFKAILADF